MSLESRSSRIDGLAIFAATAFALGVAAIMALDRAGAPAGLVRAIGAVLALIGVTVFGLGARNADLGSFMAAGRRISPFYGGLGGVAVAAGVALCLYPDFASLGDPPLLGVLIGMALGATVLGPLLRRFGATSLADVIATRFSGSPLRLVSRNRDLGHCRADRAGRLRDRRSGDAGAHHDKSCMGRGDCGIGSDSQRCSRRIDRRDFNRGGERRSDCNDHAPRIRIGMAPRRVASGLACCACPGVLRSGGAEAGRDDSCACRLFSRSNPRRSPAGTRERRSGRAWSRQLWAWRWQG